MQIIRTAICVLAATTALAGRAFAQPTARWDAGASFGFVWGDGLAVVREPYDDPFHVAYNLDLGRYWSTHFKTDVSVLLTPRHTLQQYEAFPLPGAPGAYSYTENDRSVRAASAAATYQFFDNELMHPYVSAGLLVGWTEQHRHRDTRIYTANRIPYTVPALDERLTTTLVRPFVAAGSKSYFNERTFIRSEFTAAVDQRGFSHATLRLGFGVDF